MPGNRDTHQYDDIIGLPHHVSDRHPQMSMSDRAAQFSPFAALSGYEDAVRETARLTDSKIELTEEEQAILSDRLQLLSEVGDGAEVLFTFFQPDPKKAGGAYITVCGRVKRMDTFEQAVILTDGTRIPMEDILAVQCGALERFAASGNDASQEGAGTL